MFMPVATNGKHFTDSPPGWPILACHKSRVAADLATAEISYTINACEKSSLGSMKCNSTWQRFPIKGRSPRTLPS